MKILKNLIKSNDEHYKISKLHLAIAPAYQFLSEITGYDVHKVFHRTEKKYCTRRCYFISFLTRNQLTLVK